MPWQRAARLKAEYLATRPDFAPQVAAYWAKYQKVFSPAWLDTCDSRVLKDFANSDVGAHPGNQATFNSAWNPMGDAAAGESTRSGSGTSCTGRTRYLWKTGSSNCCPV